LNTLLAIIVDLYKQNDDTILSIIHSKWHRGYSFLKYEVISQQCSISTSHTSNVFSFQKEVKRLVHVKTIFDVHDLRAQDFRFPWWWRFKLSYSGLRRSVVLW